MTYAATPTEITISIGHIEVRVAPEAQPKPARLPQQQPPSRQPRPAFRPRVTLTDFLDEGGRPHGNGRR